jgi:hypothetical protein
LDELENCVIFEDQGFPWWITPQRFPLISHRFFRTHTPRTIPARWYLLLRRRTSAGHFRTYIFFRLVVQLAKFRELLLRLNSISESLI